MPRSVNESQDPPRFTPGEPNSETKDLPLLDDNEKLDIKGIWELLDDDKFRDEDIHREWPAVNAVQLQKHLISSYDPAAGPMPIGFAHFLARDPRTATLERRIDRAARYMSESLINAYPKTWVNIIHSFLVIYTECSRPRGGRAKDETRCQSIINNLEGRDLKASTPTETEKDKTDDIEKDEDRGPTTFDLQKSIQSMSYIFPESRRPSGKESEPFHARLTPILDQMNLLKIPTCHQTSVLLTLLQDPARKECAKLDFKDMSLHTMLSEMKKLVLYDRDIQTRRLNSWNTASLATFQRDTDTLEKAARNCIEHLRDFQLDLPVHMHDDNHLLQRYQDVFRFSTWCEQLYQRTSVQETASSFAQKVITAASNQDLRTNRSSQQTSSFPVHQEIYITQGGSSSNHVHHTHSSDPIFAELIAFFSKTPPPPRQRRPYRFQNRFSRFRRPYRTRFQRGYGRGHASSSRPPALKSSHQRRMRCFGCQSPDHVLRDCPQRARHIARFQHFVDIGDAAYYFLNHEGKEELEDADHEILTYFNEQSQIPDEEDSDPHDETFESWICEMLHVFDELNLNMPSERSVNFTIEDLSSIMEELIAYSSQAVTQHILLDTGAPRSICSETWLNGAQWTVLQRIDLPPDTPPFRFANQRVQPMYGANIAADIKDLQGKTHILRLFVFVLPDLPIPFLLGLQDQRRLGFDVCLRTGNASHLRINKWSKVFSLTVTSHVWLPFKPNNTCPLDQTEWTTLSQQATQRIQSGSNCCVFYIPGSSVLHSERANNRPPPLRRLTEGKSISRSNIDRLHRALKHPEKSSIRRLMAKLFKFDKLPKDVQKAINEHRCPECEERPELPRRPKLAMPREATPNLCVSLDVVHHTIHNKHFEILVMLDQGDMLLRLKMLPDRSAMTAFQAFFSRWISIFDSPVYVLLDRGSNLTADYMVSCLRDHQSQVCPIPTEAPWSLGVNERSHGYIHKCIDRLILQPEYKVGPNLEVKLGDV